MKLSSPLSISLVIVLFLSLTLVSSKIDINPADESKNHINIGAIGKVRSLLDLIDTPSTYPVSEGLCLKVNASTTPQIYFDTCETGGGGGDITAVIAGTGLTGGGTTGDVTLNLNTTYTDNLYKTTYNATYDAHVQDNSSWNESYADTKYIGNNTLGWNLSLQNTTISQFVTPNNKFPYTIDDDGSNVMMSFPTVGGNNYIELATGGGFFQLYANPNPSNDYLLATITETQGATTEINFYEGGTGHNRFWDSGSMRIGGGANRLCSELTSDVDCDTPTTGADLVVQDDVWIGGKFYSNTSDWSNVTITESQISDLSHTVDTDTNETVRFQNLTSYDCGGTNKVTGVYDNGTIVCGADVTSPSNIFDQDLNTTNNVQFSNLTIINGGNITLGGSSVATYLYNQTAPANSYSDNINVTLYTWASNTFLTISNALAQYFNSSDITTRYYNKTDISDFNASWTTTYNATYNNILSQQCPVGTVVNGSLSNGTFVCVTDQSSGATNIFDQNLNTTNNVQFGNITGESITLNKRFNLTTSGTIGSNISFYSDTSSDAFRLYSDSPSSGTYFLIDTLFEPNVGLINTIAEWYMYVDDPTGDFNIYETDDFFTITRTDGRVGLSTTTPESKLDVNGNVTIRGNTSIGNNRICGGTGCSSYIEYNGTAWIIQS